MNDDVDPNVEILRLIEAQRTDYTFRRWNAVEELEKIVDSSKIPLLIGWLNDPDDRVRIGIAHVLGRIGDPAAIPALIIAVQDADRYVRESAADALGKIKDASVIPILVAGVRSRQDDRSVAKFDAEERRARRDYDTFGGPPRKPLDSDYHPRDGFAYALGQMNDASVLPVLIEALQDYDFDVREKAAEALGNMGRYSGFNKELISAVPFLIERVNDSEKDVRDSSMTALGYIGDSSAVPVLINALQSEDGSDHIWSAYALGDIGDPSAVPALIASLKFYGREERGVDEMARSAAAEALGKIGDPAAIPALIEEVRFLFGSVSYRAAEALEKIGGEAIPILIEKLQDPDKSTREGAIKAFGHIKDRSSIPALLDCLQESDQELRWNVLEALGEIGDPTPTPVLLAILEDPDDLLRAKSFETLLQVGDASAILKALEAIREMVSEEEYQNLTDKIDRIKDDPGNFETRQQLRWALHKTRIRFYPFASTYTVQNSKGCLFSWIYQLCNWFSKKKGADE